MSDLTCTTLTLAAYYPQYEPCASTLLLSGYTPRDCSDDSPVYVYNYVPLSDSVTDVLQLLSSQDVTNPLQFFFMNGYVFTTL